MKHNLEKVSIVIPVYKVEQYIDQCLESICIQTYKNLEIIIVFDESPDGSLIKCKNWIAKDNRIRLIINSQRKGLGTARNIGLKAATGKYIVYVDSDDWIENNYIEILYKSIERTQANYVSSIGFYEVNAENDINICKALPAGEYSSESEKMLVLLKEIPAVWKRIYNREWLIESELYQPELFHYEDWGFDIALVLRAKKIVLIPEMGLYYRNEREGCLSNDNLESLYRDFRKSIEFGLQQVKRNGFLEQYRLMIQKYLVQDYRLREDQACNAYNEVALQLLKEIKSDILIECLGYRGKHESERSICFGSFSSRWIVQNTAIFARNLEYYGFSSLIAALTKGDAITVENENDFRTCQVKHDISGAFGQRLDSIHEKTVLFFDFLEERHSILQIEDKQYITKSEAYLSSGVETTDSGDSIRSGEEEYILLWQMKCQDLIEKLGKKKKLLTIVLIKNRMSLLYGDLNNKKTFKKEQELNQINNMISELEEYFLRCCEQKRIYVEVFDLPVQYCFTEKDFKYGCEPQYMNEALYAYMGFQIYSKICA
ncbi:glycosyltransferase [Lachnospiraceae bacterium 56-18]